MYRKFKYSVEQVFKPNKKFVFNSKNSEFELLFQNLENINHGNITSHQQYKMTEAWHLFLFFGQAKMLGDV